MLVLMPDAQFEDDAEVEREVLGGVANVSGASRAGRGAAFRTATGVAPTR